MNIYKKHGSFTVVYRKCPHTGDRHVGFEDIIADAVSEVHLDDKVNLVRSEKGDIPDDVQKQYIIITSMSSHLYTLRDIFSDLKKIRTADGEKIKCLYCYSFICGDRKSIEVMQDHGVYILPLVITLDRDDNIWPVMDIAQSGHPEFQYLMDNGLLNFFE